MSPAAAPARIRFQALDALRGVCACMIVLLHLTTSGYINRSDFVQHGFLFVDFFFVLSGFVITASYGEKITQGFSILRFMGLRLGRVYPLHIAVLSVFVAFELAFAGGLLGSADRQPFTMPNSWTMLLAHLLLLHTFIGPDLTTWNGPSWSIAVEVWTYLIYALLFRWARRALVPIALLLAAACCAYLPFVSDRYLNVFHDGALERCLYGFSLGVICYQLYLSRIIPRASYLLASALESMIVAVVATAVSLAGAGPFSLAIPPIFFLAVFIFSSEGGAVSRLLKTPFFLMLGTLSYSIYMIHGFIEYRLVNALEVVQRLSHGRLLIIARDSSGNHVGGSPLFGDFMSIVMVCLAISGAWLTYRIIEKPAQDWSRRKILGKRPPANIQAAEANAPAL
jgi:peptidoglycan/LPS O-acetylase OafA/YrhL